MATQVNGTFEKIQRLVSLGDVRISRHGYRELSNDDLSAREAVEGLENATVIENYSDFPKGEAVLLLQIR